MCVLAHAKSVKACIHVISIGSRLRRSSPGSPSPLPGVGAGLLLLSRFMARDIHSVSMKIDTHVVVVLSINYYTLVDSIERRMYIYTLFFLIYRLWLLVALSIYFLHDNRRVGEERDGGRKKNPGSMLFIDYDRSRPDIIYLSTMWICTYCTLTIHVPLFFLFPSYPAPMDECTDRLQPTRALTPTRTKHQRTHHARSSCATVGCW